MNGIYMNGAIYRHAHSDTLRLVGSLKILASFAKEPCKRDYILQKRPIILRSLLIVATPYAHSHTLHQCCLYVSMICILIDPLFSFIYGPATISRLLKIIGLFCRM